MKRVYGEFLGVTNNEIIYELTKVRNAIIETYGSSDISYGITMTMADKVKEVMPELKNKIISFLLPNGHEITKEVHSFVFDIERDENTKNLVVKWEECEEGSIKFYVEIDE